MNVNAGGESRCVMTLLDLTHYGHFSPFSGYNCDVLDVDENISLKKQSLEEEEMLVCRTFRSFLSEILNKMLKCTKF